MAICPLGTTDSDLSHKWHTETHAKNLFRVQTLNNTDATGITPKSVLSVLFPFSTPQELLHYYDTTDAEPAADAE